APATAGNTRGSKKSRGRTANNNDFAIVPPKPRLCFRVFHSFRASQRRAFPESFTHQGNHDKNLPSSRSTRVGMLQVRVSGRWVSITSPIAMTNLQREP